SIGGHRADVTCPNSRRESELGSIQWLVIVEVYREWPITGGGFFRAREHVFDRMPFPRVPLMCDVGRLCRCMALMKNLTVLVILFLTFSRQADAKAARQQVDQKGRASEAP
ncbi:MAG TPA: hypothetical protein VFV34_21575, partial [Blastocatellia bacterium]|nr:hypothetical protein [Blastocatellia bacterium]